MIGNLENALRELLADALPGLFGGTAPAVQLTVASDEILIHSQSEDGAAGELRPDDRTDVLPFDASSPAGPYHLPLPPYPGRRRIRLLSPQGDGSSVRESDVLWDEADPRLFRLKLDPRTDVSRVTGVEVLYGVVSAFTRVAAAQTLGLSLASADAGKLVQGSALALSVLALNRQLLIARSAGTYGDGDYRTSVTVRDLKLVRAATGAGGTYLLTVRAELELKGTRALAESGGVIQRTDIAVGIG